MKLALGPDMHRHLSLPEHCQKTAELGYMYIEMSPRTDLLRWWTRPRTTLDKIRKFK